MTKYLEKTGEKFVGSEPNKAEQRFDRRKYKLVTPEERAGLKWLTVSERLLTQSDKQDREYDIIWRHATHMSNNLVDTKKEQNYS